MKVSIIVPVYNVERYLDQCLSSLLDLRTEFEAVLVDDGSTDGSGALCDAWAAKDSRFRVVHQANDGLSAARNTGIQNSTGDYVLFLDSDDFLDPEATDRLLEGLNSGADVLLGLYRNYYAQDDRYEPEVCGALLTLEGMTPMDRFLAALPADGQSCYMVAVRFVVRRRFLLDHGLLFLSGIYHEDEEWTGRLLCAADGVFVSHAYFYQYRQARAGAITSTVRPKHIEDSIRILERHDALRQSQVPGSVKERYLLCRMAQLYENVMLNLYVLDGDRRGEMCEALAHWRALCVPHLAGTVGRSIRVCSNVFGIRFTCFALKLARKIIKH